MADDFDVLEWCYSPRGLMSVLIVRRDPVGLVIHDARRNRYYWQTDYASGWCDTLNDAKVAAAHHWRYDQNG